MTRDEQMTENMQIVINDLQWSTFNLGDRIYVAPEVFGVATHDEIREAILYNWAGLFREPERDPIVTERWTDTPVTIRIRTWIPELFTEVYAVGC